MRAIRPIEISSATNGCRNATLKWRISWWIFRKNHIRTICIFSDAGRRFKQIYDPLNNDVVPSKDKDIAYNHVRDILPVVERSATIISTHPHRWYRSTVAYFVNLYIFHIIKATAKAAMKVPFLKRLMSRYYYLAKKI